MNMAQTYRSSKVMKFIENLRGIRDKESELALKFGNRINEQHHDLFDKSKINRQGDLYEDVIDHIIEKSYKEDGISFTHSQFSFFHSTMFHLGSTHIINSIIKEMGEFFDLKIPELNRNMDEYRIKSVDTLDYSNNKRKVLLIIGGMSEGYTDEIQEKCTQSCLEVLLRFISANEIERNEKGFTIQTALQNIPDITRELTESNIAVYGVIPVEEKD
jgi:translation initiation factor 1 (eIF-1/SUI1)